MRYLLLLLPLMLLGCADSSTTGSIRNYDIRVDISGNSGPVSLEFPLDVKSASNTDQITENASDIAPDVRFQLTEGGGTGAMSGADAVLKDVTSTLKNQIKVRALEEATEELGIEPKPEEPEEPVTPVTPVEPEEPVADIPPIPTGYETRFHHTQTSGPDKGKSLVLCPGQEMKFDACVSDGVKIPWHGYGDGRETYWNMKEEPKEDILCIKGDKTYLYPAKHTDNRGFVWGKCE